MGADESLELDEGRLLSEREAARLLGVSQQWLATDRCRRRYGVPFVRLGRLIRYSRADLSAFVAQRRVGEGVPRPLTPDGFISWQREQPQAKEQPVAATPTMRPELARLERMLAAWRGCFGDVAVSAREAVSRAFEMPPLAAQDLELAALLRELGITGERPEAAARRLGKWLAANKQLSIGGAFFSKSCERNHVALWLVRSADSASQLGT